MKFTDLPLQPFIQEALQAIHFTKLTEVQEVVIPKALEGLNLIVQSQTGSGKTHAFLLPIFEKIDPQMAEVQAVITAPSRELAEQIYQFAREIASYSPSPIRVENYIGGTDKERQISRLSPNDQPQLVIGTPGRIFDLMSDHALFVQTAKTFIVDEGDMTLDLGFLSTVDEIASRMPVDLQMMVFSATIPQELQVFLRKYTMAPETIIIEPKQVISEHISNHLIATRGRDLQSLTYDLLTMGYPFLVMVFANTREEADQMGDYLKGRGLKVAVIHGGISSRERKRLMRDIKNLDYQYVVASDLAARGIDIPGVSMVVNLGVPSDLDYFVHRVGRTGRNEVKGDAYTFIHPDDRQDIEQLEKMGIPFDYVDIQKGEIVPARSPYERAERKEVYRPELDAEERRIINQTRKAQVKPGYKKKMQEKIKSHRRRQRRGRR